MHPQPRRGWLWLYLYIFLLIFVMHFPSNFRRTSAAMALVALLGVNNASFAANFYTVVPLLGKRSASGGEQDSIRIALAASNLPEGQVGMPYLYDLTDHVQITGDPVFNPQYLQFTAAGSLPKGLALTNDGQLTGVVEPQSMPLTKIPVVVAYKGHTAQAEFGIKIESVSLTLTGATLPDAFVGVPYSVNLRPYLSVSGEPYTPILFRIVGGMLPGGLELDSLTGIISGTVTFVSLMGPIEISATHEDGFSAPAQANFVLGTNW